MMEGEYKGKEKKGKVRKGKVRKGVNNSSNVRYLSSVASNVLMLI